MKNIIKFMLPGVLLGVLITMSISKLTNQSEETSTEAKPLYWVAPMDPDFRQDQPGLSPMGMELVPVYASDSSAKDSSAGEVSISSVVANNLGLKTAMARVGHLKGKINTVGIIQYDENKLLHIHPRVEGWIEKLHVKSMGDQVAKGQLLYEIYSPELVNAQEEFILALKRNNTALIKASEARLKSLQIPMDVINLIRKQRASEQTIPYYSPQKGVIEHIEIREGFFVKPGTTLMSIADLSSVWVEAQVLNFNKPDLITGAIATMRQKAFPNQIWQGVVEYIYPSLDRQTQTLRARLTFQNDSGLLRPNMFVDVAIDQPQLEALIIPKNALIRLENSQRVVIKTDNNRYKSVNVSTGGYDSEFIQITSGLLPGDVVVTSAQFLLDSESSKSSDFDRMNLGDMENVALTFGTINELDEQNRTLNISRDGIEKWNRPPATLDFFVPEQIEFNKFLKGQKLQFYFEIKDGVFSILHADLVTTRSIDS